MCFADSGLCFSSDPSGRIFRPQHGRLLLKWGTQTWTDTCGVSTNLTVIEFIAFVFYSHFWGTEDAWMTIQRERNRFHNQKTWWLCFDALT